MINSQKILIIVPAFNESGNIARTVREILALPIPSVVLVIDDGSSDSTAREAASAGALVVLLPFNLGIGGAVQTGFKFAYEHHYDIAIQVDGDGQHDVSYVPQLIEPIQLGRADMVVGSRFLDEQRGFRSSFLRRVGIHFFANLIGFLTGCEVTDPTSGFRACNKKLIKAFAGYYPQDFPEPEAIVVAKRLDARIVEVPVVMRAREAGFSSIRRFKSFYYMIKVTFAILLNMMQDRRVSEEHVD